MHALLALQTTATPFPLEASQGRIDVELSSKGQPFGCLDLVRRPPAPRHPATLRRDHRRRPSPRHASRPPLHKAHQTNLPRTTDARATVVALAPDGALHFCALDATGVLRCSANTPAHADSGLVLEFSAAHAVLGELVPAVQLGEQQGFQLAGGHGQGQRAMQLAPGGPLALVCGVWKGLCRHSAGSRGGQDCCGGRAYFPWGYGGAWNSAGGSRGR
ncbi:MAG: hypothetical protein M1829_003407 [Trizodia sp. TS-e1964]|nr:MAG: hypothetical protein M1829_003407 [Trizodia sp. TS-e1964]